MDLPSSGTLAFSPPRHASLVRYAWALPCWWLCVNLPALAVGARWHPGWDAIGLAGLLLWRVWLTRPARRDDWVWAGELASLAIGASLDFRQVPPDALVALCSLDDGGSATWLLLRTHLQWMPCSLCLMLAFRLGCLVFSPQRRLPLAWLTWLAMLPAMLLGMAAASWLAPLLGLPLTTNALINGMACGMLLSHWLPVGNRVSAAMPLN